MGNHVKWQLPQQLLGSLQLRQLYLLILLLHVDINNNFYVIMENAEKLRIELSKLFPFVKWFILLSIIFLSIGVLIGGFSNATVITIGYLFFACYIWLLAYRTKENKKQLIPFALGYLCFSIILWALYTVLVGFSFSSIMILLYIVSASLIYLYCFKKMTGTNVDT